MSSIEPDSPYGVSHDSDWYTDHYSEDEESQIFAEKFAMYARSRYDNRLYFFSVDSYPKINGDSLYSPLMDADGGVCSECQSATLSGYCQNKSCNNYAG
jgi:hypothetical protein